MKILDRKLRKKRTLVFVDLEGTGYSHEMIEIGAYLTTLNEDGTIKKVHAPFKRYVLAHNRIKMRAKEHRRAAFDPIRAFGDDRISS